VSPEPTPRRAIRIVSQCQTKDDFIAVFHPYLERDALFVATASPEETGSHLHFVMTLAGGQAVLRGAGVVVESHRSKSNFYGLRGMKLRFDELDSESRSALRAVEAGPRRHSSAPPPPGRSPGDMLECLIYEDPGTEPREPLGTAGDLTGAEASDPGGNLPLLGADDDVTAVAEPPRRPGDTGDGKAGAAAPNGPRDTRPPGFVVPRPRSDPSIAVKPGGQRVEMQQPDTEQMPELERAAAPVPEPVPAPPKLPVVEEVVPRARRGKGTGPAEVTDAPPPPGAGDAMQEIAALSTMRLPAAEARRASAGPPDRQRHESSPPDYRAGDFTPPPGEFGAPPVDPLSITSPAPLPIVRQPGAPRRPMVPAATITPTEIVSPIALGVRTERRRGRGPMTSERTDVVRVSYVRTAAVSATLGALLGLAAGYMLWGLDREAPQPAVIVTSDAGAPSPTPSPSAPTEAPSPSVADAAPATGPADGAPPPRRPVKKPAPPARRRGHR
jgi:hypothetical protein